MKHHAKAWAIGLFKYGIAFGLLAWVISKYWDDNPETGSPGLGTLLQGEIHYGWLLAALLLMAGGLSLHMCRWYILVRALDLPFTIRNAFRLGMVGLFYNTFLPGSVGGDLVKAYFLTKEHPERKTRAVATVLIDRAMGLFGLILFVAVIGSTAWAFGNPIIGGNADLQWMVKVMAAIAASAALGFLLLGFLPQRRVDRFAGRLMQIPKVGKSFAELWYAVFLYRQRMRTVVLGVGITAISHVALVGAFHCASRVFPPQNPERELATAAEHAVIAPIGFIAQALPLFPGGVGIGEAAFAGLYKLSGRPAERGVIARLSLRITEWTLGLLGYIIYLRMKASHELPEDDEEVEAVTSDSATNGVTDPATQPPEPVRE